MACLALLGCAACIDPTFPGDARQVAFVEGGDLSRARAPFRPSTPIALGSSVEISVNDAWPPCVAFCTSVNPQVAPSLDGGALTMGTWGTDFWSGAATATGHSMLTWNGDHFRDEFGLEVRDVAGLRVSDPILFHQPLYPDWFGFDGGRWPDIEDALALDPGQTFFVEVLPLDDGGQPLAYSPSLADAGVSAPWAVRWSDHGVYITAPDAGGVTGTLTLSWPSTSLEREVTLATVPDGERAARLDLLVQLHDQGRIFALAKATALLADGGVWWEAPIRWSCDDSLEVWDGGWYPNLTLEKGLPPLRRDTQVYRTNKVSPADGGMLPPGVITARLGDLVATAEVPLPIDSSPPPPPPPMMTTLPKMGCACGSVDGLAVLALPLLLRRRSGRARR